MKTLHPDDEKALDFEFDRKVHAEDWELLIAEKLGIDIAGPLALASEIERDMAVPMPAPDAPRDENGRVIATADMPLPDEKNFGIGWWAGHALGTKRRILVGDYLLETAHAVAENLIEARLHLSTVRAHLADGGSGYRPRTGLRYIYDRQIQLHVAGMLRAIASSADCLGALAVGMLGLSSEGGRNEERRYRVLFADWGTLARWETRALPRLAPGGARDLQRDSVAAIRSAFEGEPRGWFKWARQYRHTFVHRGRRNQSWHDDVGLRLPKNPESSEMFSLLTTDAYPGCLSESAETTLRGALDRSQSAVASSCGTLLAAWRDRRAKPNLIEQPTEHWPELEPEDSSGFNGFAPTELPEPATALASPSHLRRMLSAGIPWRKHWDTLT